MIDLLRGLMDSDGTISPRKGDNNRLGYKVQYSTSSSKLRDDVLWLVRSLGGVANYSTNRNNSGYGRNNDNYEIHINLPNNINPFHLKRKVDKYNDYVSTVKRSPIKVVRKIEFDHVGEGHCITVEASDSLYLANDFIVTHNSSCIAMISQWALSTCVGTKIRVTANTRDQLRDITFPEISKWFRLALNSDWWEVTNTQVASVDDAQRQEWWCHAVTWSENNTEAFAGLHNHGKRIVMIFDEASAVADEVWEVAEGAEKDENTEIIWIAFGNPTRATGRFRECFRKFKHRWVTRQIDARTVEGINKEQIERDIADYGEDSDYVKIRIKGQFPDTSTSQFISSKIVEEAIHREPESSLYDPLIMGVDIARQGDDSTVIVQRRGLDCKSIPIIKFQCDDTMETASRIASLWHQYQHDAIFLDLGAMGYGVYDRLKMLGIPCVGVQFGGKADRELSEGGVRYRNKRSEMWGYMKDWLRFGAIPDDEKLREELTSIEAKNITVGGLDVVALEEKAELKRRIGRSPDIADSLAISFAYSVAKRNHTEEIQGIYKNKGNQHKIDYEPL